MRLGPSYKLINLSNRNQFCTCFGLVIDYRKLIDQYIIVIYLLRQARAVTVALIISCINFKKNVQNGHFKLTNKREKYMEKMFY